MHTDPPDLILRCERSRARRSTLVAEEWIEVAGGIAARSAQGSWGTVAAALGLSAPATAEDIARVTAWFASNGASPRIDVCDRAPISLLQLIANAGYRATRFVTVLVRRVDASEAPRASTPPAGVRINTLDRTAEADCAAVARALERAFEESMLASSGADERAHFHAQTMATIRHPDVHTSAAWEGSACVGAGLVDVCEGIAGLWIAGVVPEARRRGIQRAIISHRLATAARLGATHATIESDPGGPTQRNAVRMGFRIAYSRLVFRM